MFGNIWKPTNQSRAKVNVLNQHAIKTYLESFKETFFHQDSCQDQPDLLVSGHSLFNIIYPFHNLPHLHPLQAEPPQATTQADRDSPRLCKGAFGLQKLCQIVDGLEGARMHRAQLIFTPRQGPAMELLGLAQGCGWATAGWRPMPWRDGPCAVIRSW